jgi:hypothetical protein
MRAVSILTAGLAASFASTACGNGDDSFIPAPLAKVSAGKDASPGVDATAAADAETADAEPFDAGTEASGEGGDEPAVPPVRSLVRLANWSADSPAVDFCLAPHGSGTFQGPLLAARTASMGDGGPVGALPFPQATPYLLVDPAQYDARVVAAGSADCATSITDGALSALSSGGLMTIALVGAANPQNGEASLEILGFTDELKSSLAGALAIRVINAHVDLAKGVEVGLLNPLLTPFTSGAIPFGSASVAPSVTNSDSNGYVVQIPLVNQIVAARAAAPTLLGAPMHTIVAQAPNISLAPGNTVTFVVVDSKGQPGPDGGSVLGQLLECVDTAGTASLVGACKAISP